MHSPKPGAKILHYFNEEDCWVRVRFKNGDSVTRTYTRRGTSELVYEVAGKEAINTTLATTGHEQKELNRLLNLDWDIFCGSTFFTQFATPWLEMSDQKRKKAIERVLHLDRFEIYTDLAKQKKNRVDSEYNLSLTKKSGLEKLLADQKANLQAAEESSSKFDDIKRSKHAEYLQKAAEAEASRDAIELQDIEELQEKWDLVAKIEDKIKQKERSVTDLHTKLREVSQQISHLTGKMLPIESFIQEWNDKAGKICTECEQAIPHAHTDEKIKPKQKELQDLTKQRAALEREKEAISAQLKKAVDGIASTKAALESSKPKISLREAVAINSRRQAYEDAAQDYLRRAEKALEESDPNLGLIDQLKRKIEATEASLEDAEKDIQRMDVLVKHYSYLQKLYSDRKKIKSSIISEHIPYFNRRLAGYLDGFGLDIRVTLTENLAIESNMWGYEFESGGERRRTDVAFALAMFDLHSEIYGRQSNVVVLDEVDGRMDSAGVEHLVEIINNDIASKVETVLVISHKPTINDVFPREITIARENRVSRVIETR